jgi:hypothetical protein
MTNYIQIAFTFAGGLLGAAVGNPIVEWFKDRLAAQRHWQTQQEEIVSTIRLIGGVIEAFREIEKDAFCWTDRASVEEPLSYYPRGCARLANFDLTLIDQSLNKLAALHPVESRQSAIGQRLIHHLMVLKTDFEEIKKIGPVKRSSPEEKLPLSIDASRLITESEERVWYFEQFLSELYAKRMGIDGLSLIYDLEVRSFDRRLRQQRNDAKREELAEQMKKH